MCIVSNKTHRFHIEKHRQEQNTLLKLTRIDHMLLDHTNKLEDLSSQKNRLHMNLLRLHMKHIKESKLIKNKLTNETIEKERNTLAFER